MNGILALAVTAAILYAWAGACLLFFRFSRPESEETMRRFLNKHYSVFTERAFQPNRPAVTPQAIREAGLRGWIMSGLPLVILGFGLEYRSLLISSAVLFFAGLQFAHSWYGLRCLRVLGLDSYAKKAA